jgi:hypothetical protein
VDVPGQCDTLFDPVLSEVCVWMYQGSAVLGGWFFNAKATVRSQTYLTFVERGTPRSVLRVASVTVPN